MYHHIDIKINSVKEIDIKVYRHNFLDETINIKNLDLNKIKIINRKSTEIQTKVFLFTTLDSFYLYKIINKINGHIEASNGNKYFTSVLSDKSRDTNKRLKNYRAKSEILLDQFIISKLILSIVACITHVFLLFASFLR